MNIKYMDWVIMYIMYMCIHVYIMHVVAGSDR